MYASKIFIIIYISDTENVRYSIMMTGQSLPWELCLLWCLRNFFIILKGINLNVYKIQ